MPLTEQELAWIRSKVGDDPDEIDLEDRYTRLGDVTEVVREVLSGRLANLLAAPASITIPGEYAQNTAANIKGLQEELAALGNLPGVDESVVRIIEPAPRPPR